MNPQEQDHMPSFELPPAQVGEHSSDVAQEQQQVSSSEKDASIAVEHNVSQPDPQAASQQATAQAAPANDVQATAVAPGTKQSILGSVTGWMPQIADDTDLIEKEWVIKAKEIVAQTAHDPHLQSREMTKFKAEYMKKRYNKDLKLSEDS